MYQFFFLLHMVGCPHYRVKSDFLHVRAANNAYLGSRAKWQIWRILPVLMPCSSRFGEWLTILPNFTGPSPIMHPLPHRVIDEKANFLPLLLGYVWRGCCIYTQPELPCYPLAQGDGWRYGGAGRKIGGKGDAPHLLFVIPPPGAPCGQPPYLSFEVGELPAVDRQDDDEVALFILGLS